MICLKINDRVEIITGEGNGKEGIITKISDIDPIFRYEVTVGKEKLWKKASQFIFKGEVKTTKKRGRPPGKSNPEKPKKLDFQVPVVDEELPAKVPDLQKKYREIVGAMTLDDFFKFREKVNSDYEKLVNLDMRNILSI